MRMTKATSKPKLIVLSTEQQIALMRELELEENRPFRGIVAAMLFAGMSPSEACGLRWRDVDMQNKAIHIRQTLHIYREGIKIWRELCQITDPCVCRTIPMSDFIVDALLSEKRLQEEVGLRNEIERNDDNDLVFTNRFGSFRSYETINRKIHEIVANYNCNENSSAKKEGRDPLLLPPSLTCRDLRRTFGVHLCDTGVHIVEIQKIMGYRDIYTVLNLYQLNYNLS